MIVSELNVLTTGRVGVDLCPLQDGVGLEDVQTFDKYLGGGATNVAVAAARRECATAMPPTVEVESLLQENVHATV